MVADAGVAVVVVVPVEEPAGVGVGVFEAAETPREVRSVLEGPELAFGVRVVVGHVGPRVRLGDTEISEEVSDGLGDHRPAPIRMDGQLVTSDALTVDGFAEQRFGQSVVLRARQHPAGHIPAVNIDDHLQVVVGALLRALLH